MTSNADILQHILNIHITRSLFIKKNHMFYYDGVHCFKRLIIDQNTDYHIMSIYYYSWEIITVVFVVIIFLLIMIILRFITCTLFWLI